MLYLLIDIHLSIALLLLLQRRRYIKRVVAVATDRHSFVVCQLIFLGYTLGAHRYTNSKFVWQLSAGVTKGRRLCVGFFCTWKAAKIQRFSKDPRCIRYTRGFAAFVWHHLKRAAYALGDRDVPRTHEETRRCSACPRRHRHYNRIDLSGWSRVDERRPCDVGPA